MPRVDITQLPDSARLFVYNTARALDQQELELLRTNLEAFLDQWAAHGSPLTVGYALPYDHFVVIAVDDSAVGPSGCSIDASYQFLKAFTARTGIEILDAPDVCFRDAEGVRCVSRSEFNALASNAQVDATTTVFNNTITTLGDFRAGRWEVPARESWHARAYKLREAARA
jgi:hypothetical protein